MITHLPVVATHGVILVDGLGGYRLGDAKGHRNFQNIELGMRDGIESRF